MLKEQSIRNAEILQFTVIKKYTTATEPNLALGTNGLNQYVSDFIAPTTPLTFNVVWRQCVCFLFCLNGVKEPDAKHAWTTYSPFFFFFSLYLYSLPTFFPVFILRPLSATATACLSCHASLFLSSTDAVWFENNHRPAAHELAWTSDILYLRTLCCSLCPSLQTWTKRMFSAFKIRLQLKLVLLGFREFQKVI